MVMRLSPTLSLLAGLGALFLVASGCSQSSTFQGTEFNPVNQAPNFNLQDQFGKWVSSDEFTGKVVVLAFLYTGCPDVCSVVTETLRKTYEQLGEDTKQVQFVAISVDPERDTVEQVHRYSEQKGMLHKWAFLVGEEEELAATWASYYVAADRVKDERNSDVLESLSKGGVRHDTDIGYLITHTNAVYLIDGDGRLRILFTDLSLDATPLVHDIRLLL